MSLSFISRLVGVLLLLFSLALVPPIVLAWVYSEAVLSSLLSTLSLCLGSGAVLWLLARRERHRIRTRDGFLIVTLLWGIVSLAGSLPFMLTLHMDMASAFFESASAFTTTGATVLSGLDQMPRSILLYRQELQWLGGIGVVVSAVALMPMLGIGGMQLYKAETAGPIKDEKLTPRIAHTARVLWRIYGLITLLCAFSYWLAGMDLFDAICHSLATVSTGGFSTHDASIGYFHSSAIEAVAVVFMLLGSISFNVHYLAIRKGSLLAYWQSIEVRVFLLLVLVVIMVIAASLYLQGAQPSMTAALRYSMFETVSVVTSTGFGIGDFSRWPGMLPVLLIFISFVGGCAGSTAGGMKVIRFILLTKQALLEVMRLIHPRLTRQVKLGGKVVGERVVAAVWGFFAVYVAVFVLFMLLLMANGVDQVTAFGAVATSMNNLGPGLGKVATDFTALSNFGLVLMGIATLMGRLEIFTVLVLLSPAFWKE
jgi:trk system potassium uptake protein TrkH